MQILGIFFVHGISYTDLSLLKEFSNEISFKDFHNFIWTRLSISCGSCLTQFELWGSSMVWSNLWGDLSSVWLSGFKIRYCWVCSQMDKKSVPYIHLLISPIPPPVDLFLNFEKSSWKNWVRQTGFLACKNSISKLIFERLHRQ